MTSTGRPLPRGRHRLSRAEVTRNQRDRILDGLAEAMSERGFVATSVADVIRHAGVSRETFYQQFASKADAFDAALDIAWELLTAHLLGALGQNGSKTDSGNTPELGGWSSNDGGLGGLRDRVQGLVGAYLDAILEHRAHARLHLVEVWAAGPGPIARRAARQRELARLLSAELSSGGADVVFASELIVGGLSTLVTAPLLAGDDEAVLALRGPAVDLALRVLSDPSSAI